MNRRNNCTDYGTASRLPPPQAKGARGGHLASYASASALASLLAASEMEANNLPAQEFVHTLKTLSHLGGNKFKSKSGESETFWQYREYHHSDSAARIDWRKSAKSDHVYVRQRELLEPSSVVFFKDSSASMNFSSSTLSKAAYTNIMLLTIIRLLCRCHETPLLMHKSVNHPINQAQLEQAAVMLLDSDDGSIAPPFIATGSYLIWAGDFYCDIEHIRKKLEGLKTAGVTGLLLAVHDPLEADFSFKGHTLFMDFDNKSRLEIGDPEVLADAYRKEFRNHMAALEETAKHNGFSFFSFPTAIPVHDVLTRIISNYLRHSQGLLIHSSQDNR